MPQPKRSRAETVRANDERLRDALAGSIFDAGWDGVSFTGVAKRAGLTVGAVYGRAENAAELGIDLWQSRVFPWVNGTLTEALQQARAGDAKGVGRALGVWDADPNATAVAIELLIAALFDPDLGEVVRADMLAMLEPWTTPSTAAPRVPAHHAAAATLVASFVLGRALAVRGGARLGAVTPAQTKVLAGYFDAPSRTGAVPKPQPLQWVRSLDDVDPAKRAIIEGTLRVVGRVGYRRATIARIARAAGAPRGSILTNVPDKAHLVADAASLALVPPGEVWAQYAPVVAARGALLSRAMFLADFLQEGNRELWALNLELARIARYIPQFEAFRCTDRVLENTHLGVMLVASFTPALDHLPYARVFLAGTAT